MVSLLFLRRMIMMDYEVFKSIVKENFLAYMPPEYRDAVLDIRPSKKVNRTQDALTVRQGDNSQILPTIYVNDMYEHYQACGNLREVLEAVAENYAGALKELKGRKMELEPEHLKENVIMCLVNTEQNWEMLAGVPSREFHDLSVIYRWVVETTPDAVGSIIVTDNLAEMAGMTEEELFRCAVENTRRLSPVSIKSMDEVIFGLVSAPPEMKDIFMQEGNPKETIWVISNEMRVNGAVSMLYEENLHQLAEKVGDDLFIFPSSIHEVIAMPAEMAGKNLNPEYLAKMVHEVNMESVELEERLSNSVYHYDRNARSIALLAESPEKRLDGKAAEMPLIPEKEKQR